MSEPNSGKNGGSSSRKKNHSRNNRRKNRKNDSRRRYGSTPRKKLEERNAGIIKDMENQARGRFEQTPLPMGFPEEMEQPKTFKFDWKLSPVPLKDEEAMSGEVMRKGEFGWLEDERVDEIAEIAKDYKMTLEQALSLRSALLQQKTVYGHGRLRSQGKNMLRLYKEGVSVVDLSTRFDFPPMNIFRIILTEMRWSKSKIKESLRQPSRLSERERTEFEAAEAADRVSNVDQGESQERADLFEDILADWFEEQGVRLRRQPEMVKEQKQDLGRPVRTPDILFLDHVEINGKPVAWIDAKHFYGADVDFQRKKMAKQMARYIEEGEWCCGLSPRIFREFIHARLHLIGCEPP